MTTASRSGELARTTEQAFGNRLHTYTMVDAMSDKNVLPLRIEADEMIGFDFRGKLAERSIDLP